MSEVATSTAETPVAATTVEAPAVARAPDGKFAAKPTETAPPAEAGATTEQAATAEPPTEAKEADEPKRNRTRERIDQLTAEKHAAIREAANLKARLAALQQAPTRQVDPNDFEGQQRESFRQVMREEQLTSTASQLAEVQQRAAEAQFRTFQSKVDVARERIPDIDRSLQDFARLPVSEHAAEIIAESDVGAEIAHYLANNPRQAFDIHAMSPAQQGRALAQIEARVSIPTRRTSAAPPPPPMVTGAQAAMAKSPAEMSAAEYIAARKAEWAKGKR